MSALRTLVVHAGALGDFLLACPALLRLVEAGPVVLAGSPERQAVAVAAGLAERAIPLDALGLHEVFAADGALPLPTRFQEAVQGFDRAVIWMRDPGDVLLNAFRAAGVRAVQCAPGLPQADWPGHAAAYYCASIGVPEVPDSRLNIVPEAGLDVVIAPGSGSPRKNWPLAHYEALSARLEADGRHCTWLLGPAEEGICLPSASRILQDADLVLIARQLAGAHCYIGNDTGTTHLAALVGCPTVAIFGPTSPETWRPIGPHVRVLSGGAGLPTVEDVFAAAISITA